MAQNELNNYKYIIIPKSYGFSKSEDQYQLNSLTKFLFNKYGYEAYFTDEMPEAIKTDRCLALKAEVSNEESGLFKTKLEIILSDCYDAVIMKSKLGESRIKEYKKAYHEALREAFETFQNLDYRYEGTQKPVTSVKTEEQPVEETTIVESNKEATTSETSDQKVSTAEIPVEINETELYYAQAITNGFQLVNAEPKIVMVLLTTPTKDVYMVKGKNAIVFKKDNQWIFSENDGTTTSEKVLNIKF